MTPPDDVSDDFRAARADSGWYNVATAERRYEGGHVWHITLHADPKQMSELEWERTMELLRELRTETTTEDPTMTPPDDIVDRLEAIRQRTEAATEGATDDPLWFQVSALADWIEAEFPDKDSGECLGPGDVENLRQAKRLLRDVPYLLSLVEAIPGDEVLAAAQTAVDAQLGEWKERAERHHRNGSDESFAEKKVHELREAKEALADLESALRDAAQEGAE